MADQLAKDEEISELVAFLEDREHDDLTVLDRALSRYPSDPRLHFMRGSVLAGQARPIEAHAAMVRAIELAPGFRIARYQLGFFELTSGEADRALSTWGPLLTGPADDYLRVFVEGMTHLIRDEFSAAIRTFEHGISLNHENEPLNNDIRLLIKQISQLESKSRVNHQDGDDQLSATSLMLGQFNSNRTLN
ncbi:tetratricopeptide repeat protein [Altererythrobacter sp. Z27]|uniref:tetratricopeptide repeat protein n=1 Tax=Altererythrobacter sp. Z27 TaxID=3461147 RepID=UPI004044B9C6